MMQNVSWPALQCKAWRQPCQPPPHCRATRDQRHAQSLVCLGQNDPRMRKRGAKIIGLDLARCICHGGRNQIGKRINQETLNGPFQVTRAIFEINAFGFNETFVTESLSKELNKMTGVTLTKSERIS